LRRTCAANHLLTHPLSHTHLIRHTSPQSHTPAQTHIPSVTHTRSAHTLSPLSLSLFPLSLCWIPPPFVQIDLLPMRTHTHPCTHNTHTQHTHTHAHTHTHTHTHTHSHSPTSKLSLDPPQSPANQPISFSACSHKNGKYLYHLD